MDSVQEKVKYAFDILNRHQTKCGDLLFFDEKNNPHIKCVKCNMVMKKSDTGAIFTLKGYDIELS